MVSGVRHAAGTSSSVLFPPRADTQDFNPALHFGMGRKGKDAVVPLRDDGHAHSAGQSGHVLIVEDEALIALDMAMILGSAGYRIMGPKATGDAALAGLHAAAADGTLPDLILMDIALRGTLDGIDTVKRIKSKYAGLPVGFVTGQADPITRARAEATGPAGYLLKPFTPEQLIQFVKRLLGTG